LHYIFDGDFSQHAFDRPAHFFLYASEYRFDVHPDKALVVWPLAMQREDVARLDRPVNV
jgi:hypothetical protein